MKRGSALAPLSREHHTALVVAAQLSTAAPDDTGAAAAAMLADHAYLRSAARRLQAPAEPITADELHAVGTRLRAHVQTEQRELFPYLEQTLEPAALQEMGARLQK